MEDVKISGKLYVESEGPTNAVKMLIESSKFPEFDHLNYAKIKCLFKDKLSGYGWNKLGKIIKVNDLYWALLDLDIIVIFNKNIWDMLEQEQKIALASHLLSKIKVYWKYEGKKKKSLKSPNEGEVASFNVTYEGRIDYTVVPPDIEEFEIVKTKFPQSYNKLKEVSQKTED